MLAATAGTARHALVVDEQLRSTVRVPAYRPGADVAVHRARGLARPGLTARIDRAALELAFLLETGFAAHLRAESWQATQHEFGSASTPDTTIDLDSDLMRLATGGSAG